MSVLSGAERDAALAPLLASGWAETDGGRAITRRFTFADFETAFGWMASVALHAAKMDHHPDWSNSHRRVDVTLTSHDAKGVTGRDVRLATIMEELA